MGRLTQEIRYRKRSKNWEYKLKGMSSFRTTGKTTKAEAERYAIKMLQRNGLSEPTELTFAEYAKKFFIWDQCPHTRRLLDEGKSITRRYVEIQRMNLEKHILPSNLRLLKVSEIRRAHIIDFRSSLTRKELAAATVNKIMDCLKVIINEAFYREDIHKNPVQKVGNVHSDTAEIDIFTLEELNKLFPARFSRIWSSILDYSCFFLTAHTGMRRGEVLALKWKHISFDEQYIKIEEAWKSRTETGNPKWENKRIVFMTDALKSCLLKYWEHTANRNPEDLVFSYSDGSRLGDTWWKKHFDNALEKAGIDTTGRRLRPHSFRHTLNTLLLSNGVDPEKVRAVLGWKNESVQARYTHWKPEHLISQGAIIDKILAQ